MVTVLQSVNALLATIELDELGEARASLARVLAEKMDQLLVADGGQVAQALPAISKELREVIDAIQEASDDSAEFVTGLFSKVGDSAKS